MKYNLPLFCFLNDCYVELKLGTTPMAMIFQVWNPLSTRTGNAISHRKWISTRSCKKSSSFCVKSCQNNDLNKLNVLGFGNKRNPISDICVTSPTLSQALQFWIVSEGALGKVDITQKIMEEFLSNSEGVMAEALGDLGVNHPLSQGNLALVVGSGIGSNVKAVVQLLKAVQEKNKLAVCIFIKPFIFEAQKRREEVEKLITDLAEFCNMRIVVDSNALLETETVTLTEAITAANNAVHLAVIAISSLMSESCMKLLDAQPDISRIVDSSSIINALHDSGEAAVGFGTGTCIKSSVKQAASECPFLSSIQFHELKIVVICVLSAKRLDIKDMRIAIQMFREITKSEAKIICSAAVDTSLECNFILSSIVVTGNSVDSMKNETSSKSNFLKQLSSNFLIPFNFFLKNSSSQPVSDTKSEDSGSEQMVGGGSLIKNILDGLNSFVISENRSNETSASKQFSSKKVRDRNQEEACTAEASGRYPQNGTFQLHSNDQTSKNSELGDDKLTRRKPGQVTRQAEENSLSDNSRFMSFKSDKDLIYRQCSDETNSSLESNSSNFDSHIKNDIKEIDSDAEGIEGSRNEDYFFNTEMFHIQNLHSKDQRLDALSSEAVLTNETSEQKHLMELEENISIEQNPLKTAHSFLTEGDGWADSSQSLTDVSFDALSDVFHAASVLLSQTDPANYRMPGSLSTRAASMLETERGVNDKLSPVLKMKYRGGMYKGRCQGGLPHGKGHLSFNDRSFYVGQWRLGKRSGSGSFYYCSGDVFHGTWRDDLMHGKGWLYFKTGDRFFAEFWKGKANGEGRYYSYKGEVFFGHFQDNLRNGKGLYIDSNGNKWEEFWESGALISRRKMDSEEA